MDAPGINASNPCALKTLPLVALAKPLEPALLPAVSLIAVAKVRFWEASWVLTLMKLLPAATTCVLPSGSSTTKFLSPVIKSK